MSNTRLWDKLGKTDPSNTKSFKRAGGFSGTAIKPMWSFKRMTEEFGPCGIGWGVNEPTFQVVPGENKEILVYCTVSVWYAESDDGLNSIHTPIFGVGGDKVVTYIKANEQYNRPERWESDDEAFKKAYTDAIGNALKLIGVGADVHMGMFDDSKYVNSMRQEFSEEAQKAPEKPAKGYNHYLSDITNAKDEPALKAVFAALWRDKSLTDSQKSDLKDGYEDKKRQLTTPDGYVPPSFPEGDAQ